MRIIVVCCALSIALPGTAQAANRFASPGGAGTACTAAAPCALTEAVNSAVAGDDVAVAPGTYGTPMAPITTSLTAFVTDLTIHGTIGQPAIVYAADTYALIMEAPGDRVSDLTIHQLAANSGALYLTSSARADRVTGLADGPALGGGGVGCILLVAAQLENSVCAGIRPYSNGLVVAASLDGPDFVTARNVTAIASNAGAPPNDNQGDAILITGQPPRSAQLTLINTIAIGAEHDLRVAGAASGAAQAVTSHTYAVNRSLAASFSSVNDSPSVLAVAPSFVGPSDFHEADGSSSIDTGSDSSDNGPYDVEGTPRMLGAHTDVGAYERRVAAAATTAPASDVTATGATLHGHVAPNGSAATFHLEYGTTTAYGASTPQRALAEGTPALDVSDGISGLAPGTTYHARIVVTGPGGGATGDDVAFTTPAAATVTVAGPAPKPAVKPCTVPSVKSGSTMLATVTKLAKAGCRLGATTKARSKKVHKGRVVRLTIKAHTKTTKAVGIVVSRGRH